MVETIPNNCGTTRHLSQQINDTLIASQRIGLGSPEGLSSGVHPPPALQSRTTASRPELGDAVARPPRRNKRPPGRNKRLQAATSGHQAATWPRASVGQNKKKRKAPGREKKGREQFITSLCSEGGQLLVVHLSFVRNLLFFKNKIFNRKK